MNRKPEPPDVSRTEEFMRLFTRHQRYVYCYVRSLVPNPAEVEEIVQQTNLLLWEKFSQFQPGSNFRAWACKVAHLEVLKHRARHGRDELLFSDAFLEEIAAEADDSAEYLEAKAQALEHCRQKLSASDQDMLDRRYRPGGTSRRVADELGRPTRSVYKSLSRIRKALLDCVSRRLGKEGRA